MASWFDNAWNFLNRNIGGSQVGQDVGNALNNAGGDVWGWLKNQAIPGPQTAVEGPKSPTFGGQNWGGTAAGGIRSGVEGAIGGGGGGSKPADPAALTGDAATAHWLISQIPNMTYGQLNDPTQAQQSALETAIANLDPKDAQAVLNALPKGSAMTADVQKSLTPQTQGAGQQTNDALTMGMGMFFQQYLAPMMQQMNQANNTAIQGYGTAMNQALKNPLPPGVAQIMSAQLPQQQGLMSMLNAAGAQQAAGAGPFQQFIQGVGGEASKYQSLIDAVTKLQSTADVTQLINQGGLGALGIGTNPTGTSPAPTGGTQPASTGWQPSSAGQATLPWGQILGSIGQGGGQ